MLSLLRERRRMMKGLKLENPNHCNFSYLVDNTGCELGKCILLRLLKEHLPFGQALDLRSHTTSVWPLNLLRFFLCFTFFARRNAAGYRQHPPRSAVPTPFGPGLEKWNWAFLGMAIPEKETVTTAENLSVLSLCWLFFLAPVQQIKRSLQSEMLNKQKNRQIDMEKIYRLGQGCSGNFPV